MSMYGAHVTTRNIRDEVQKHHWSTYGTWAGCFAGLSNQSVAHLRDDQTAIATIALASTRRNNDGISNPQRAQRAFLFGEFAQRLTGGAFLSWEHPDVNTPVGNRDRQWGQDLADVILNAQLVHFRPQVHQDLIVSAFRISNFTHKYGIPDGIPQEDWEFLPLAQALGSGDGLAYSDSAIIFGTPNAERVIEFVGGKYDGDWDEIYDDDLEEEFADAPFTQLTEDGLKDMLTRTSEEFAGYCRQGLPNVIEGYTKDIELSSDEVRAMRPDDPIGLAAPMRFIKSGGRRIKNIPVRELVGIIKEITRG